MNQQRFLQRRCYWSSWQRVVIDGNFSVGTARRNGPRTRGRSLEGVLSMHKSCCRCRCCSSGGVGQDGGSGGGRRRYNLVAFGTGRIGSCLIVQLLPDMFLPDWNDHVRIRASPGGTTRREMLVADIDVVARIFESDGLAPGSELGPCLLAGRIDVRGWTAAGPDDLTALAKCGKEDFLLAFDDFSRGEAAGNGAELLSGHGARALLSSSWCCRIRSCSKCSATKWGVRSS